MTDYRQIVVGLLLILPIASLMAALSGDPFQPPDSPICLPQPVGAELKGWVGNGNTRVAWLLNTEGQWLSLGVGELLPATDWWVQAIEQQQIFLQHPVLNLACPEVIHQQVLNLR